MSGARARALVALLALVTACGRVGPPVAPERRLPLPPTALSATIRAGEIVLSWQNPTHRADHSRVRDVEVVRLYRTSDAGQGEAKPAVLAGDQVVGYERLAVIRLEQPEPAVVEGRQVRVVDRADLTEGRRYTYVVTASDGSGRTSPPSARLSLVYITAPEPHRPHRRARRGGGAAHVGAARPSHRRTAARRHDHVRGPPRAEPRRRARADHGRTDRGHAVYRLGCRQRAHLLLRGARRAVHGRRRRQQRALGHGRRHP
ncbi:MAG: hypothetical protein DME06_15250, partial [Candidatus Rokuibacteriota bacterium]